MSIDNFVSKPNSGTRSPTGPRPPKTEAEFLAWQRANALRAMRQTAGELGDTLKIVANEHPWLMLSGAAVAGALAARALSPSPARTPAPLPGRPPGLFTSLEQALIDIVKGVTQSYLAAAVAGAGPAARTHNGAEGVPTP